MASYDCITYLTDLIPFVPQLREMFFIWVNLDDNNRKHIKLLIEQCENKEIKPIILALEQWEYLQNNHGAPGVEKDFVVCDDNTLQEVMECSISLNEIILEMACVKSTLHLE